MSEKKSASPASSVPQKDLGKAGFCILSIQHVFAMFGSTVLVPALTGINPGIALLTAGIGTLIFHAVTKGIVPVFLGSSFAFIGVILTVGQRSPELMPYATGGLIAAGITYVIIALLVKLIGANFIHRLLPPVVTGPVIIVIGLHLAPVAVQMAAKNWILAIVSILTIIFVSVYTKGFFKLVPIILGIIAGYIAAFCMGEIDFTAVNKVIANGDIFVSGGDFMLPKFSFSAIMTIAPIAIVTSMEHIGDLTTNGAVVGRDFFKNPGLHRTLLGDGLATMLAGFLGGPANTTYSENTGVLAVTRNYNPAIIRMAAVVAIFIGILKPFGVLLQTIPEPVMGGVSFILFGMIASIGMRTIAHSKLDFSNSRNLLIVSLILVAGIGGVELQLPDLTLFGATVKGIALKGIGLAALVGLVSNLIMHILLPDNPDND